MADYLGERHKAMDAPSQDEKVQMAARHAVVMHLEAYRKIGMLVTIVVIATVIAAIIASSFWPFAIAVVISISIYFYVIQSCLRFVERQTGMPQELQAFFNNRYTTDVQFKKEVDELHKRVSAFSGLQ